jgi:hypothetical protein
MDASAYLRRKKEAMTQYIHRTPYLDAGVRTEMLARNAASVSKYPHVVQTCCSGVPPQTTSNSSDCCQANNRNDLYTTPYITKGCCPMIYAVSTPTSTVCSYSYQATPAQQRAAWAHLVNSSNASCCTQVENEAPS